MLDGHRIAAGWGIAAALLLCAQSCLAQDAAEVKLPTRIEAALGVGQHRLYRIVVPAGHSAKFALTQRDATLILRVSDADGGALTALQDDAGRAARVRLTLNAEHRTRFTLDIAAAAKQPADFELTGVMTQPIRAIDRAHAAAEHALAQAENLRRASGSLEHGNATKGAAIEQVLAAYEAALDIAQRSDDACMSLMAGAGRARYQFALGRYADARVSASAALGFRCGSESDPAAAAEEAVAQRTLGSALGYLGDFTAATAAQERALALYRLTGDLNYQSMALGNLSADYRVTGATYHALRSASAALKLAETTGNHDRATFARENIAAIHLQRGEWGAAREWYLKTLAALHDAPYPLVEGMAWMDLGQLHAQSGEDDASKDAFAHARAAWTQAGNYDGLAETWLDEADVALAQGRIAAADALYQNGLAYDLKHGLQREQAHALIGLGRCATARSEWDLARADLQRARELAHAIKAVVLETSAYAALGDLASRRQQTNDAQRAYAQAYALAVRGQDFNSQVLMLGNQARLARERGALDAARSQIAQAIALIENEQAHIDAPTLRTDYFASRRAYYDLDIDVLMRLDQREPGRGYAGAALAASEQARARALRDRLRERNIVVRPHAALALLAAEQEAEDALREAAWRSAQLSATATADARASAQQAIDAASRALDGARGRLRDADPRYAQLAQPRPLELATIQHDLLDDHVVALEYWLGDTHSYLWRITPTSLQTTVLPSRASLDASAAALRAALIAPGANDASRSFAERAQDDRRDAARVHTLASRLGHLLMPESSRSDSRQRVIIADGTLQRIPFDLLDSNPSLVHIYLPSLASLRELRAPAAPDRPSAIAVFADPVFSAGDPRLPAPARVQSTAAPVAATQRSAAADQGVDGLARLPQSNVEAVQIASLMPPAERWLATGFAANRASVLDADWSRYRLVHFATHAWMDQRDPDLSGIVLSLYDAHGRREDGIVRMQDLYNLRMRADLVSLGVCDSTDEPERGAEGMFGLSRAFFHAGARRLLVSLWPVDDRASAALMAAFYRNLIDGGQSPQRALQAAQRTLRREPRWHAPYYWAGFVIQGDWR